jgi:hypothetical protein
MALEGDNGFTTGCLYTEDYDLSAIFTPFLKTSLKFEQNLGVCN